MASLKLNTLSNFAGKSWAGLLALLFIPIYIKVLGIESWGLIGFFATLQALLYLLDMGLSATLNRELARLSSRKDTNREQRDLTRTLEMVYWGTATVLGLIVLAVAPYIALHGINSQELSAETVTSAIRLMGLVFIFQFPFSLYQGGLMGLQRQVLLNGILGGMGTLRSVGAVVVLWWMSPTVEAFFVWQLLVSILQVFLLRSCLWRFLPKEVSRQRFRKASLLRVWRFAAGMTGITFLSIILNQLDKVILLKVLPLKEFSYYAVGMAVSRLQYMVVTPIQHAVFPRLAELAATNSEDAIKRLYHQASQLTSVLVMPPMIVLILYSREFLMLWTRDADVADHTSLLLALLAVGSALHSVGYMPYSLQLAYGWTSLVIKTNIVLIFVMVPLQLALIYQWGTVGAAAAWIVLKLTQRLVSLALMHRRLLPTERWRWCIHDVTVPLVAAVAAALAMHNFLRGMTTVYGQVLAITITGSVSLLAAAMAAEHTRHTIFRTFRKNERIAS